MLKLYDFLESGNGYKVRLMLKFLELPYELILKDILKGETRTEDFLSINPNGRIPALQLDDGRCLAESNAILFYLAEGTPFLPDDKFERAEVLQWMFFEQYSHEPYLAVVRFWKNFITMTQEQEAQLPARFEGGLAALKVMEGHLQDRDWFVGDRASIADIALYPYTHMSPAGGFNLSDYPAINRWMERIQTLPGYDTIEAG